jgi:enamine deaminase RidA (YjgF/YER057c/UK114 family)
MCVKTYALRSREARELLITARPGPGTAADQAREVFAAIGDRLRVAGARLLEERIFCDPGAVAAIAAARTAAYRDLDDGVAPTMLAARTDPDRALGGVQVHAVTGCEPPTPVRVGGRAVGRVVRLDGYSFLTVSGLSAPRAGDRAAQARAIFEASLEALEAVGGEWFCVDRTWMWLGDVLAWYDSFNTVRNRFFAECGLIHAADRNGDRLGGPEHRLPASTGIGVGPATGGDCMMDLVATIEHQGSGKDLLMAGGNQGSAFDYGSAFSRVLRARSPGGMTTYVSGTASIDDAGRTVHRDDPAAQIDATLANIEAVLRNMDCTYDDVVQGLVYCKTPAVARVFRERWGSVRWPYLLLVCDVCRDDLLFEVEVTACPGARDISDSSAASLCRQP